MEDSKIYNKGGLWGLGVYIFSIALMFLWSQYGDCSSEHLCAYAIGFPVLPWFNLQFLREILLESNVLDLFNPVSVLFELRGWGQYFLFLLPNAALAYCLGMLVNWFLKKWQ